ncbi:MAG: hypothetical protein E7359_03615 [Clostridiales bacterium]|nr:hypothetical protein [Clostridiales bacterium]
MLDKFGAKLLSFLNENSKSGDFVILELDDIFANFKNKINKELLNNTLNYLTQNDYIKIKYLDNEELCYSCLTKARIYKETNEIRIKGNKQNNKYLILNIIFSSIAAFFGAFVAIMIVHFFL